MSHNLSQSPVGEVGPDIGVAYKQNKFFLYYH